MHSGPELLIKVGYDRRQTACTEKTVGPSVQLLLFFQVSCLKYSFWSSIQKHSKTRVFPNSKGRRLLVIKVGYNRRRTACMERTSYAPFKWKPLLIDRISYIWYATIEITWEKKKKEKKRKPSLIKVSDNRRQAACMERIVAVRRSNGSLVSTCDNNFYFVIFPNTKIEPVLTPVHEARQLYYDCPTECDYLHIVSPTVTIIGNFQQVVCDMSANRRLGIISIKTKKIH